MGRALMAAAVLGAAALLVAGGAGGYLLARAHRAGGPTVAIGAAGAGDASSPPASIPLATGGTAHPSPICPVVHPPVTTAPAPPPLPPRRQVPSPDPVLPATTVRCPTFTAACAGAPATTSSPRSPVPGPEHRPLPGGQRPALAPVQG